jgi:hypothetical protein
VALLAVAFLAVAFLAVALLAVAFLAVVFPVVTGVFSTSDCCAFPWRGVGICGAFSSLDPCPVSDVDPPTRGRSWWSELMHLTSVGGHCSAPLGRGAGLM